MTNLRLDASHAERDFRLAWRWLLPSRGVRRVFSPGFSDEDGAFLARAMGLEVAPDPGCDALWAVSADAPDATRWLAAACATPPAAMGVLGAGTSVRRWSRTITRSYPIVREYGLLPSHAPRVIVPLGETATARAALRLHRPGRRLARSAVEFTRALLAIGVEAPVRRKVLLVASQSPGVPQGAERANLADGPMASAAFALYLGTQGMLRTTVVLPLAPDSSAVIAKTSEWEEGRRRIRAEADALRTLARCAVASEIPRLFATHDGAEVTTLVQEYRERQPTTDRALVPAVTSFLCRMASAHRERRPLRDDPALALPAESPLGGLAQTLRRLAGAGASVWRWPTHGDFAPWNLAWTERGLLVFDWEEYSGAGLAFSDAFHFVLAPARLVGSRRSPERLVGEAICLASKVATTAGIDPADVPHHLALWLIDELRAGRDHGRVANALERGLTP